MVSYNKSALQAYSEANIAGVDGKTLSLKILKSVLFYIDKSILEYDKNKENTIDCYQMLNNANKLLVDIVENMNLPEGAERDGILTILQKVEMDVLSAMKNQYYQLRTTRNGLETIISIMES